MDLDGRCASTPSTSAAAATGAGGTNARNENGNQQQQTAPVDLVTFEANFVSIVAEQLGIDFPSAAGQMVAQNVSSFLRRVFKMARKFQKNGRRKWLIQEDLEVAMAYFGYSPLLGYDTVDSTTFKQIGKQGRDIFVREDQDLELMAVIHSTPPKLPLEPSLKAHWLVINGTQPAIAENPLSIAPTDLALAPRGGMDAEASTSQGAGSGSGLLLNQLAKTVRKTEQVQIKQMTTHALSMEQQVFFLKIMEAIMGQDEQKRIEALNCLQMDCGLRALLPRFSIAITEGVRCNIVVHNMAILVYLMRMILALSQNVAITLEPCLHELLPTIMSCILSRQLSSNQQASETHCVLREFSSDLLAQLLRRYRLPHIHTRVIRALSKAFEQPNYALPTLYGAVTALCELGPEVIQRVILPNLPSICASIHRVISDKLYSHERSLGERLYNLMLEKLTAVAKDPGCEIPLRHYQDFQNAFGTFADDIYKAFKTNNNNNNVGQLLYINNNNLAK